MSWADLFKEGVKKRDIIAAIQSLTAAPPNQLCGYVEENNNMKKMMTLAEFKALTKPVEERWLPPTQDEDICMPMRPKTAPSVGNPVDPTDPVWGKQGEWVKYEQPKAEIAKDEFEPHVLKDWERLSGILND